MQNCNHNNECKFNSSPHNSLQTSRKTVLSWDAVLVLKKPPSVQYALLQHLHLSLRKCVLLNGSVFWLTFLWGGCVWIMLNVRLCFFFFYERVCFVVVFVRCWRCLIRTHTVCVRRLSSKNASVLWESLSDLWRASQLTRNLFYLFGTAKRLHAVVRDHRGKRSEHESFKLQL